MTRPLALLYYQQSQLSAAAISMPLTRCQSCGARYNH